ncbi:enolase C-terminal domain-like protein [Pseudodonghicola flavimaris]|uniref:Enolase C-terminal domain-like protein n=1 Tax=Pseudodonghicola flavimaris TaxID=3050036 RepID=A0ABT7F092_9RHOB|nr:enolase C-terminal domain-like protein [Pseudodonghicola flavimaris]MDK3018031.1 enolase C-terminal domain-like protein [Pseudodonghicola flavimaris]
MRITAIHEATVPLSVAARSANISFDAMTASAVALVTDVMHDGRPVIGLAFDTIGRYGHGGLLRERFMPRLLAADPDSYAAGSSIDPQAVWDIVMRNEKFGGHGERSGAVGLIDAAVWDLAAKLEGVPLWRFLAAWEDRETASGQVAVYASGGHYAARDDLAVLRAELQRGRDAGHTRMKIKIGGAPLAEDIARIEVALDTIGAGGSLALDANGTFDLDTAAAYLRALEGYPIAWLEEPGTALDYQLNAQIADIATLPLAVGENLFSFDDTRNLLRYGGLRPERDLLQMDISASYGLVEYGRILRLAEADGWARDRFAPHAGQLFAMQCAAGLGLGLAEVAISTASLFGRITAEVPVADGIATLPETPGVGFERLAVFNQLFGDVLPH